MTNFVKIHCMTAEKLAEFLERVDYGANGPWYKWFDRVYCKKCEAEAGDGDLPCDNGDCCVIEDSTKAIIQAWLESEYYEGILMKLRERAKALEAERDRYRGVIRILEADVKRARREGAEDLAKALMRAYGAYDKGHMVSVADILEDIRFFSRKYTEG